MADVATIGLHLDGSQYKKEMKDIAAANDSTAKNTAKTTGRMKKSFTGLLKSINPLRSALTSLVAGVSFGAVIKNAADFETKMKEVSTLLDDTSSMDALTEGINRMALAFGDAPVNQAGAIYDIISAGAGSAAEALGTLEAANKLAIGGVTDIGTAADGLTSVLNAYGDKVEGVTAVSDAFFTAMKAGKTTVGQLASSVGLVAPLAVEAGVSFDELLASIAALTKGGIQTKIAVQGMRAVLAAVAKPTSEATEQIEKLNAAGADIDFSISAIQQQGFLEWLNNLKDSVGGNTDAIAQLFGGVEAIIPILNLTGVGIENFNEIMGNMATKSGATEVAYAKMQDSFKQDALKPFLATVSVLAQQIGTALLPVLGDFLKMITSGLQWIQDHTAELKFLAKVVMIGGALYLGLQALPLIYTAIGAAALVATKGTAAFSGSMVALSGVLTSMKAVWMIPVKGLFNIKQAMILLASFAAGWEFGKYLSENFEWVRIAAHRMVAGVLSSWELLKAGWMKVKQVFTGGGLDFTEINENLNKKLDEIELGAEASIQFEIDQGNKERIKREIEETIKLPKQAAEAAAGADKATSPVEVSEVPDDVVNARDKVNDLIKEYAKNASLAADATELERIQYELLNGELAKAGGYRQQELLAAAAKSDEIRLLRESDQLLEGYTRKLALSAQATEKQRIEYELTKGKLQELNDERKEELKLAAQLQDQSRLVVDATSAIKSMNDQMLRLNVTTQEQAVLFELTNGGLQGLGDEYANLEEQVIMTARALDDARFKKEAEQLEMSVDPAKRYAAALERINMLRDRGGLSAEAYSEAVYRETLRTNKSVGIMRDGFADFFKDLQEGTLSVKDAFFKMVDSIQQRMNDLFAEQLADQLTKGLFSGVVQKEGESTGLMGLATGAAKKVTSAGATEVMPDTAEPVNALTGALGGPAGISASDAVPVVIIEDKTATRAAKGVLGGVLGAGAEPTPVTVVNGVDGVSGVLQGGEPTPVEVVKAETVGPVDAVGEGGEQEGMFSKLLAGIGEKFTAVKDSVVGGFGKVFGFIKDGFGGVFNVGKEIISGIGSGMQSLFSMITQAITAMTTAQAASSASSGGGDFFSAIGSFFSGGTTSAATTTAVATGGTFVVPQIGEVKVNKFSQGGSAIAGALMASSVALPSAASQVEEFAQGASFRVGGSGGIDSQLVMFKASPNERVTVTKPDQTTGFASGGRITFSDSVKEKIEKFSAGGTATVKEINNSRKDIHKFSTGGTSIARELIKQTSLIKGRNTHSNSIKKFATGGIFVIKDVNNSNDTVNHFSSGGIATTEALSVINKGNEVKIPAYANGADFRVGGSGGLDSQLVMFRASPNERVTVEKPDQDGRHRDTLQVTNNFHVTAPNGFIAKESQAQMATKVARSVELARRRHM